jgi:hypothetical protein
MNRHAATALWLAILFAPVPGGAQELRVESDVPRDRFIARDAGIELSLSRPLDPAAERVAVFFGTTDVTPLFAQSGDRLRYSTGVLPLPSGERDVIVYHVTEGGWREVARHPMKVVGRLDIETTTFKPRLDLSVKGRFAYGQEPAEPAPERPTYHTFEGQLGLESEVVRLGGGRFTSRSSLVGSSERESRLRFRDKGPDAPAIDLSTYMLQAEQGPLRLAVGHVAAGNQRHLMNRFSSRGATFTVAPSSRVEASFAALHGSNLVGWDDLLGITDPDHRFLNATVGVEALARPGALRVELSALDGSVLPRAGVNRGAVTDAERSRGVAVRVLASGFDRRLRLDAGLSRSAFDNPPDPLLAQGTDLVPLGQDTRGARYVETSLDVLRGVRLGSQRTARVTLGYSHEQVDPLFRTVAAFVRADQLQNKWELRGDVAGVTVGASHVRSENNLENVPSILKSHTRRSTVDLRIPVAAVLGTKPSGWWPSLGARVDRTHQFGAAVPAAGGFDPSHVPDQVSDNHSLRADWRWRRASFGYQLNRSFQDNRQPGREDADLGSLSHESSLSVTPVPSLSLTASAGQTAARNHEREETDSTRRYGLGMTWRPFGQTALTLQLTDTHRANDGRGSTRDDRGLSTQWSSPVPGLGRFGGTFHLRHATTHHRAVDPIANLDQRRSDWFIDSGFSLRFF